MWLTAKELAQELNVSPRTIVDHAKRMEREGLHVATKMGKPKRYHRETFLDYQFGGAYETKDLHGTAAYIRTHYDGDSGSGRE
jgi:predicted ArsR family transcriptional regulator